MALTLLSTNVFDASSPTTSPTFSTSIINKSVRDLGTIPADIILPSNTNVGCRNCTIFGNFDASAGGYDPNDSDEGILFDFARQGFIDMTTSNLFAHIDLDTELLPGFKVVDTFISIYNKTVASISVNDLIVVNFAIEVGFPLSVVLDTPVTFTGGFELTIPQASFRVDVGDFSDSSTTGFDTAVASLLPYHVSAPDLAFSAITGFGMRIHATATTNSTAVNAGGKLTFELGVPDVNLTAQVKTNVDDNCNPSSGGSSHSQAIDLMFDVGTKAAVNGLVSVEASGRSKELNGDNWPSRTWPIQAASGSQCLYDDRLKASFLAEANSNAATRVKDKIQWIEMLVLTLAVSFWLGVV